MENRRSEPHGGKPNLVCELLSGRFVRDLAGRCRALVWAAGERKEKRNETIRSHGVTLDVSAHLSHTFGMYRPRRKYIMGI